MRQIPMKKVDYFDTFWLVVRTFSNGWSRKMLPYIRLGMGHLPHGSHPPRHYFPHTSHSSHIAFPTCHIPMCHIHYMPHSPCVIFPTCHIPHVSHSLHAIFSMCHIPYIPLSPCVTFPKCHIPHV